MDIKKIVSDYLLEFPCETERLKKLLVFLECHKEYEYVDSKTAVGHITVGAVIIDEDFQQVLLKPNKNLPEIFTHFGGHLKEENSGEKLFKQARSTVGITNLTNDEDLKHVPFHLNDEIPIDIDIHFIEDEENSSPHLHFDFRYIFVSNRNGTVVQTKEGKHEDSATKIEEPVTETIEGTIKKENLQWKSVGNFLPRLATLQNLKDKILMLEEGKLSPRFFFSKVLDTIKVLDAIKDLDAAKILNAIKKLEEDSNAIKGEDVHSAAQRNKVVSIVVPHLLPDVLPFLEALNAIYPIRAIIPKPKSIVDSVEEEVIRRFGKNVLKKEITRKDISQKIEEIIPPKGCEKFIIYDIGGWFADSINEIIKIRPKQFLGIVEDTENGFKKYKKYFEDLGSELLQPKSELLQSESESSHLLVSVAKSPLKDNEDYLIGNSIVFSTDVLLRERGELLQYKNASIFGFGKIGRSIFHSLASMGIKANVYDWNPVIQVSAINQGATPRSKDWIIRNSEIIFCATGGKVMDHTDFSLLKNGCYIVSVTSSDDEFDINTLERVYESTPEPHSIHIEKMVGPTNCFYLMNKGNAVNFLHRAVVGDFIHLVKAEMIFSGFLLASGYSSGTVAADKIIDVLRKEIASCWTSVFARDAHLEFPDSNALRNENSQNGAFVF